MDHQRNVLIKQEPLEVDGIPLHLLQHKVPTIKSEKVSNEDNHEPESLLAVDPGVINKLELNMHDRHCHVGSDENIFIKQELLQEELVIKSEDEAMQNDKYNCEKPVSGRKLYKCTVCNYSSTLKSNLKRHLISHTGEKFFKCILCEFNCTLKINLIKHLKTHSEKIQLQYLQLQLQGKG